MSCATRLSELVQPTEPSGSLARVSEEDEGYLLEEKTTASYGLSLSITAPIAIPVNDQKSKWIGRNIIVELLLRAA